MTATGDQLRIAYKNPVRLATTANHGLSGLADIDGVTPVAGDRILVRTNSTGSQNGIYIASATGWSRSRDMNETHADRVTAGLKVFVQEGTTYGQKTLWLTTIGAIVLGTTSLTFEELGGGGISGSGTDERVMRWNGTDAAQDSLTSMDDSGNLFPATTDVGALGLTTNQWADLFLASGGVVNWDNGDATLTHSADKLSFAGAADGYHFDASLMLGEMSAAIADVAGKGQIWVKDDEQNTLWFTDDTGVDFPLNSNLHVTQIDPIEMKTTENTSTTTLDASMNGLSLPQSTITVADTTGFDAATSTAYVTTSDGVQIVTYTGLTGTTFTGCTGGTGTMSTGGAIAATSDVINIGSMKWESFGATFFLTVEAEFGVYRFSAHYQLCVERATSDATWYKIHPVSSTCDSAFFFSVEMQVAPFGNYANFRIRPGNWWSGFFKTANCQAYFSTLTDEEAVFTPDVSYVAAAVTAPTTSYGSSLVESRNGEIHFHGVQVLSSQGSAPVGGAGTGIIWVDNASPTRPWFTDSASNDFQLALVGAADDYHLFTGQTSSPVSPTTDQGAIWFDSSTVYGDLCTRPRFTDDLGTDYALQEAIMLTRTVPAAATSAVPLGYFYTPSSFPEPSVFQVGVDWQIGSIQESSVYTITINNAHHTEGVWYEAVAEIKNEGNATYNVKLEVLRTGSIQLWMRLRNSVTLPWGDAAAIVRIIPLSNACRFVPYDVVDTSATAPTATYAATLLSQNIAGAKVESYTPLFIKEQSSAPTGAAGWGSFWVQDDAPTVPKFTDDAFNDWNLVKFLDSGSTADNAITRYDGATGEVLQDSEITINDDGDLLPKTDDTQDLGSSSLRFQDLYLGSMVDYSTTLQFHEAGSMKARLFEGGGFGLRQQTTGPVVATTEGAFWTRNSDVSSPMFSRSSGSHAQLLHWNQAGDGDLTPEFGNGLCTNRLKYSSDLSNAAWLYTGAVRATGTINPRGISASDEITFSSLGGGFSQAATLTDSAKCVVSFWAKDVDHTDGILSIRTKVGSYATVTIPSEGEWRRYYVETTSGTGTAQLDIRTLTGTGAIDFFGVQLEERTDGLPGPYRQTENEAFNLLQTYSGPIFSQWLMLQRSVYFGDTASHIKRDMGTDPIFEIVSDQEIIVNGSSGVGNLTLRSGKAIYADVAAGTGFFWKDEDSDTIRARLDITGTLTHSKLSIGTATGDISTASTYLDIHGGQMWLRQGNTLNSRSFLYLTEGPSAAETYIAGPGWGTESASNSILLYNDDGSQGGTLEYFSGGDQIWKIDSTEEMRLLTDNLLLKNNNKIVWSSTSSDAWINADGTASTGDMTLQSPRHIVFQVNGSSAHKFTFNENGALQISEQASGPTAVGGYGQFWVQSGTASQPMFTSDISGAHYRIALAGYDGVNKSTAVNYSITTTDYVRTVLCTPTTITRTITLPNPVLNPGRIITVVHLGTGAGNTNVNPGTYNINGSTTDRTLGTTYDTETYRSTGSAGWIIVASHP